MNLFRKLMGKPAADSEATPQPTPSPAPIPADSTPPAAPPPPAMPSEPAEAQLNRLLAAKDYLGLAAMSVEEAPQGASVDATLKKHNLAREALLQAGPDAVDGILNEFLLASKESHPDRRRQMMIPLAEMLYAIGDDRARPVLKSVVEANRFNAFLVTPDYNKFVYHEDTAWAKALADREDYAALVAYISESPVGASDDEWKQRRRRLDLCKEHLRDAGPKAVEALIAAQEETSNIDLAVILAAADDPRAVPVLKKRLDRGDFRPYSESSKIEAFVALYPDLHELPESCACALCGKTRAVTEMRFYTGDGQILWFCVDTCWTRRGQVIKLGIGYDCPYYAEGMCKVTDASNLCALKVGPYAACPIFQMGR